MVQRLVTLAAFCLIGLVFGRSESAAQERVIRFDSVIEVFEDNSLLVTEKIMIRAEGNVFKRGIVRSFPLTRRLPNQKRTTRVGFEIVAVERDGQPEPFHTESSFHSIDIYVGDANVLLEPYRDYTYSLTYRTTKQIGFFDTFDELYWNVNGNGWALPFEHVTATVILPIAVGDQVLSTAAYTGLEGEQGSDFRTERTDQGYYFWETNRTLGPYEGLTIAIGWPVGSIQRPTEQELAHQVFLGQLGIWVMSLGALLIAVYYGYIWVRVGVDPRPGTVIPLFYPPQDLSAAAMRYVRKMGWDNKAFSAALLGAASKGWLTINQNKKKYSLERSEAARIPLSQEEKAGYDALLGSNQHIDLDQKYHATFAAARKGIQKVLKSSHDQVHFRRNTVFVVLGVLLSLAVTISSLYLLSQFADIEIERMVPLLILAVMGYVVTPLQVGMVKSVTVAWREPSFKVILSSLFLVLVAIPMLVLYVYFLAAFSWEISVSLFIGLLIIFLANAIFGSLMKARTPEGRTLLDQIEGFRMFLRATEKERLEFLHPPDRTPELFERYLPYAVALDVENRWADQFSSVFSQLEQEGQGRYSPSYYHGNMAGFSAANFSKDIGSRLTSSLSTASSSPSSGSGGGGSSGGGGGGGGGGGW